MKRRWFWDKLRSSQRLAFATGFYKSMVGSLPPTPNEATPRDYQVLAKVSEQLNLQDKYWETIEFLRQYEVGNTIDNTSFWNELGIAYGKVGTKNKNKEYWRLAYDAHKKAYDLDPREPMYLFNLAFATSWLENLFESRELFENYLESGHTGRRDLAQEMINDINRVLGDRDCGK